VYWECVNGHEELQGNTHQPNQSATALSLRIIRWNLLGSNEAALQSPVVNGCGGFSPATHKVPIMKIPVKNPVSSITLMRVGLSIEVE